MADRLWKYYMQVRLRHRLLVLPILVNLRGGRPGAQVEMLHEGFRPQTAQFHYQALSLSGCLADEYLARPEPLAWAFAAQMKAGERGPAWQKADCMHQIVAARLSPNREWLLAYWVATYLELTGPDAEEYQRILNLPAYREVKAMEMTWGEKMIEQGRTEGRLEGGIEALRQVVLRLLGRRFGEVPERVQRRVEAIESPESLNELAERVLDAGSIDEMGLGE